MPDSRYGVITQFMIKCHLEVIQAGRTTRSSERNGRSGSFGGLGLPKSDIRRAISSHRHHETTRPRPSGRCTTEFPVIPDHKSFEVARWS